MNGNTPSSPLPLQYAQRIAVILGGLLRAITIYPPGNPALGRPVAELHALLTEALASRQTITLGLANDIFFLAEHPFIDPPPPVEELAARLRKKSLARVTMEQGVEEDEIIRFTTLLGDKNMTADTICTGTSAYQIRHIHLTLTQEEEEDVLLQEAHETYGDALTTISFTFGEVENHKTPDSDRIQAVTRRFASIAMKDPAVLLGLAMIKDYDNYTFTHSVNVGVLAMALAATVGYERQDVEEVGMAGLLHDIGKTRISKEILNKPGKLSASEFAEIKQHPEQGAKILAEMSGISPRVTQGVLGHHIHHNRQGYPEWARKFPIDPISEIIAIADCYDASTTLRAYQRPLPPDKALFELQKLSGNYLDRNLVDRFVVMMGQYPVGTLVRLESNEIAVVSRSNPLDNETPRVKVIIDSRGERVAAPQVRRLSDQEGKQSMAIAAVVDPVAKGIDVGEYFR